MKRLARAATITRLRDELEERGSWCGETHIQKAVFFLQEAGNVPLERNFMLYKHGPFSFDLRDDLVSFRVDGLVQLKPQIYPYGPRLMTTELGQSIQEKFPRTLGRYGHTINRVAEFIGSRNVAMLEQLGTALLFILDHESAPDEEIIVSLREAKPHINDAEAAKAIAEVRNFLASMPA